jgi:hypothetical protein
VPAYAAARWEDLEGLPNQDISDVFFNSNIKRRCPPVRSKFWTGGQRLLQTVFTFVSWTWVWDRAGPASRPDQPGQELRSSSDSIKKLFPAPS